MGKLLIAVGGTGQEIALATLRLSHMAGVTPPTVLVFDADRREAKEGVATRADELRRLGESLRVVHGGRLVNFFVPLANTADGRSVDNLVSLFGAEERRGNHIQEVLSLLLTARQQTMALVDGFHGDPTVGSFAAMDYLRRPQFANGFKAAMERLTGSDPPHFVVVAGSTGGGTGSSVIPLLSRHLTTWRHQRQLTQEVDISGVLQLPWFDPVEKGDVPWSRPPEVDVGRLRQNSVGLVDRHLADLDQLMDRLVLLGLPLSVGRVSAGSDHQPETKHCLNVLSGWMAAELLTVGRTMDRLTHGGLYGYALNERRPMLHFHANDGSVSLSTAVNATRVLSAFGRALSTQLQPARLDVSLPRNVYRFLAVLLGGGREAVGQFLETFRQVCSMDEEIFAWFDEACRSGWRPADGAGPHQARDHLDAFGVSAGDLATTSRAAARLVRDAKWLEHDFVAHLLGAARIRPTTTDPKATALALYRALKRELLTGLLRPDPRRSAPRADAAAMSLLPVLDDPGESQEGRAEDFFRLDVAEIRRRLGHSGEDTPPGLGMPLAQIRLFERQLEEQAANGEGDAVAVLRLIVLLQHFNHLRESQVSAGARAHLRSLAPVLHPGSDGTDGMFIVSKLCGLGAGLDGHVFAGRHLPLLPFFPAAGVYPDAGSSGDGQALGWRRVRRALVDSHGPDSADAALDGSGTVIDRRRAAALVRYLKGYLEAAAGMKAGWITAFAIWHDELAAVAGDPDVLTG